MKKKKDILIVDHSRVLSRPFPFPVIILTSSNCLSPLLVSCAVVFVYVMSISYTYLLCSCFPCFIILWYLMFCDTLFLSTDNIL